jgi:hypothetical protein
MAKRGVVFAGLALATTLALHSCATSPTPPDRDNTAPKSRPAPVLMQPGGNNEDAADFARAMTEIARQSWPKSQTVWNLELVPQEVIGDIQAYRRRVTYCKATISMSDEWLRQTESGQRNFLRASLDALHKAPLLPLSDSLDYYPNSSGEVSIKVGSRVVASGTYTRSKMDIRLEPGTFVQEKDRPAASQFHASLSIVREGGAISSRGTTNLGDGESILVSLEGPNYFGQTKVTVNEGMFVTELFSNKGRPLSAGAYSLQLNVFNPKTMLLIEAKRSLTLFSTGVVELTFGPVNLSDLRQ